MKIPLVPFIRNRLMPILSTALLAAVLLSPNAIADHTVSPTKDMEKITKIDAAITARQHYRQHPLNDEISALLFHEYFKTLDPNKIYFTEKDIAGFAKYKTQLDDQLNFGQVNFAFDVYNLYLKKVSEFKEFLVQQLKKGFNFKKRESYSFDRADLKSWPQDESELKDVWRKKIKNDILTYRLMAKAKEEKLDKSEEKQNGNSHSSWEKKPEERVLKRIEQYINYLEQNDPIDVLEIYLSSFKKVYDPHSSFLSPASVEDFNISMKLSLVGIGAVLTTEDGYTKIVKLIPGGPAEKDNRLKPEDRIIAVAQENSPAVDIIDMPLSKVVKMIRGKKDTKVYLTILEGSKGINALPKVITIKRDTVKLKEQEAKGEIKKIKGKDGKELKVGVINLPSFYLDFKAAFDNVGDYKSSTRDVKRILLDFKKQDIDGLIVDIRSNGGGSLVEAIKLTGLFIENGPVVQIRNQKGLVDKKYDPDEEIYYTKPLIVMTNRFSASASEIFAGAIQDYSRGLIVGDSHTHGKGTVQTIFDLKPFLHFLGFDKPAGSIKLTTAKFYRINGSSTQEKGVKPDIVFPSFSEVMKLGEKHLDHALPWDAISPEAYQVYDKKLTAIIPQLRESSHKRQEADEDFKLLKKDIVRFKKLRERKEISLNEDERWNEYLKERELLEEQTKLMKLSDGASTESEEDKDADDKRTAKTDEKKDIYLEETLNIMRDYIDLDPSPKANAATK